MGTGRTAIGTRVIAIIAVLIIIVGIVGIISLTSHPNTSTSSSASASTTLTTSSTATSSNASASTASTTRILAVSLTNSTSLCTFPSGSGAVLLRVLSDSDSTPVAGALVTTSYEFPYTCVPGANVASTTSQAFESFTTTSTEWYYFSGLNEGTFSFSVEYGGQTYDLTASQGGFAAYTCVTLEIPSGAVDTTYGQSCSATGS